MTSERSRTYTIRPPAFYVPVNLNPKVFPKQHRRYVAYFLNLLHWKYICWQADEKGWIRLKTDYLTKIIPRDVWPDILNRLVGRGVIHYYNCWTPGVRSKGYRLAPEYRQTKRIVCTNDDLAKRIRQVYAKENTLLPVHKWLAHKLELIDFDLERALRIISTLHPDNESRMPVNEYHDILIGISELLANGDATIDSVDRFGRVHTPITRLVRELRPCLSIDDERLINIDLTNSQPLIAGIVAAHYIRDRTTAQRLRERVFEQGDNPYHRRSPQPVETDKTDLLAYINKCEAGTIYESLMKKGDRRDSIKREYLTAMYSKNSTRMRLKGVLMKTYPTVGTMLKALKLSDYRHAAHVMQNVESTIFIHGVCRQIVDERPETPVLTIHDSLMTTPDHVPYVKSRIEYQFAKLGIHPTLKQETLE